MHQAMIPREWHSCWRFSFGRGLEPGGSPDSRKKREKERERRPFRLLHIWVFEHLLENGSIPCDLVESYN